MPVETLCALFPEMAALFIQVEHAPIAAERAEAELRATATLQSRISVANPPPGPPN